MEKIRKRFEKINYHTLLKYFLSYFSSSASFCSAFHSIQKPAEDSLLHKQGYQHTGKAHPFSAELQ